MKKFSFPVILFLITSNSWALSTTTLTFKSPTNIPSAAVSKLANIANLRLYKDFSDGTLTPDYVNPDTLTNPVFTFTSAYDATHPASYPSDTSGTITTPVTTANAARFVTGFWQITSDVTMTNSGFIATGKGLLIDGAITNGSAYSEDLTQAGYWSKTNTTVGGSTTLPNGATGTKNVITASADGGTITAQQTSGNAVRVFYIWLKRVTGSGTVWLTLDNYGTAIGSAKFIPAPVDSSWKVFSIKTTCANPRWGIKLATNGDAVAAWGAMVTGYPFYSSYVPTISTANLSKTADTLTLSTNGLINSDVSTIIMQFVSLSNEQQNGASAAVYFDSGANSPKLTSTTGSYPFKFFPRQSVSASVNSSNTGTTTGNSYTVAMVSYGKDTSPYSNVYVNGTKQIGTAVNSTVYSTNVSGVLTVVMGSNMYFGASSSSTLQPGIILKKVLIYGAALTDNQIATVNTILGGTWEANKDSRPKELSIGDSITAGTGETNGWGYRVRLQYLLGPGIYQFVGPYRSTTLSDTYGMWHAGVSGERTDQILNRLPTHLSNYLISAPSGSIVTLHAGTNDVTGGRAVGDLTTNGTIIYYMGQILDTIYAFNPNLKVYVAKIIPRLDANDAATTTYNTALNSMLQTKQTTMPNLHIVDMNAAFKANPGFTIDETLYPGQGGLLGSGGAYLNVHPTDAGYQVMANTWASCIESSTNQYCDGH